MNTKAYKIQCAHRAGLTLKLSRGHLFWDGLPEQWDVFDWLIAYYQQYKTLASGNYVSRV